MNINDLFSKKRSVAESQLNEVDPRNFDSDVDYYAAVNAPAKPKNRGQQSPGVNPDDEDYFREIFRKKREAAKKAEQDNQSGVAEGSLNEGQYEMMMRNGQVKKFIAKDDADAKRIAAGHGAKSVIRLKGGVPAGKIAEQGVAEGLDDRLPQETLDLIDEYIAKVEPGADRDELIKSVDDGYIHTSELEYALQEGLAEAEQQKGADYRDPPEANYDDDYQAMVKRMKQLAGTGPLKTVHDPARRVYKNIPTAVQPKTQPRK